MKQNLWYKNAIFYQVYVRAFFDSNADGHGDIQGLTSKLDYFQELGVDCLWVMPTYPSPLKDDGYDIADYYGIHPDYGTLGDFKDFLDGAHRRGIKVITDLVLNHTSDQHPWFQAARADRNSPYRDYYVWSDDPNKYNDARIIFVDIEKSNWTWDEAAGQYFWHRFYSSQPDLNYDNPAVRAEMLKVIQFWLDMGVDGFRVDAVPYLFEREGTTCENLPETHAYIKEIRRFIDTNYEGRILLSEANQWPVTVRTYMGDGDEFHLAFHFPIMPRIFMALQRRERSALEWALENTPPIPGNCQWCTFLRNHDELTLEMVTPEERSWMWDEYAPYQRMRLNLGIRRRLAPLLGNDPRRILLANSLLFTLPGSPVIYYGDEFGMGDNIWLPDRTGVRTPMQWDNSLNAGFSSAQPEKLYAPIVNDELFSQNKINVEQARKNPQSLWHTICKMVAVRKQYKVFGWGDFQWVDCPNQAVAAYARAFEGRQILVVNNLSNRQQDAHLASAAPLVDLLSGAAFTPQDGVLNLALEPYGCRWLMKQAI